MSQMPVFDLAAFGVALLRGVIAWWWVVVVWAGFLSAFAAFGRRRGKSDEATRGRRVW